MSTNANKMNPFPGLRPFTQEEDYLFFGREEQTIELLQRLGGNRFVAVVGTSGSGKSSLVRCGLLSELLGGKMLQAGASWEIAVTHPGGNPLALLTEALVEADLYDAEEENVRENLLATLSRSHFGLVEAVKQADLGEDTNFLLVVDQFEEIFRFHEAGQTQQEVANEFVSILLEAVAQSEVPIYVVLTMRSDFIGECGHFEGLAEMVNRGEFLIPRLSREQYKRVIEGPTKVGGGKIAPRLLQRLLNDLGQQGDQLPCLQHALMRTWDASARRDGAEALDLDDYQSIGRMAEALSLHADEIYDSLETDRQRELCQGIFQALTVQESENRGIRRPQRLGRLCRILNVEADELLPIIDAYRQSGVTFLMPSADVELTEQTIVDISHESLMRVWTRLRHWVDEEAQAAGIYLRLSESATLHAQQKAGLYRDPELGIALTWKESRKPNAAWAERYQHGFDAAMKFLDASQQASVAEEEAREAARQRELEHAQLLAEAESQRAAEQARSAVRLGRLVRGLALVVIVALTATVFAWLARQEASRNAEVADQKAQEANRERTAALTAQAETQTALTQVAAAEKVAVANLETAKVAQAEAVQAEESSRQYRYATDMQLAAIRVTDETANAGQILNRLNGHDPAQNEELHNKDDLRGFEWHYLKKLVDARAAVFDQFDEEVTDSVVTADGELVTLNSEGLLQRWDGSTRQQQGESHDLSSGQTVTVKAMSADGKRAAIAVGSKVQIFDTTTGEQVGRDIPAAVRAGMAFSPDGRMLITVDASIGWWDATTCKPVALQDFKLTVYSTLLNPVSVSADGLTVAVGGQGNYRGYFSVFRLNPETREITRVLDKAGANGTKRTLAISPDGGTVAISVYFSGEIYLYDASSGKLKGNHPTAHAASVSTIAFHSDNNQMVTGSMDGAVKVWNDYNHITLQTPTATTPADTTESDLTSTALLGHTKPLNQVAFAADGTQIVSTGQDKTVRLWNLNRKDVSLHQSIADVRAYHARFSPDGTLMVVSNEQSHLQLRDPATGQVVLKLPKRSEPYGSDSVAISPDGRLLAAGFGGANDVSFIELWDIDSGEKLAVMPGTTAIPGFTTDANSGMVTGLAFSPDGKHLVAAFGTLNMLSGGNASSFPLLVYDVDTHRIIRRLEGHQNYCMSVAFSRDGAQLASASQDGTARIWDTRTWKEIHALNNPDVEGAGSRRVNDVAFSADGKYLAMASAENNVIIWDTESGEHLETLRGHANEVWSVAFSVDGRTLASGSRDGTVRLWNTATWQHLVLLDPGTDFIPTSLDFSPDGRRLLAASPSGASLMWSVQSEGDHVGPSTEQLSALLKSETDFAKRIRMQSGSLQLQESLEQLSLQQSENMSVVAALAATRSHWHASQKDWNLATEHFDVLKSVGAVPTGRPEVDVQLAVGNRPDDWLRTPGLLRVANALLHQDRSADAAGLLVGGEAQRAADGHGNRSGGFGFTYVPGVYPLKVIRVFRGSPAWQAGLRSGDSILKFSGIDLTAETVAEFAKQSKTGEAISLTVQPAGEEQSKTVEATPGSHVQDDLTVELIENLLATLEKKLAESPDDPGLLELRAEIAGQSSDYEQQVTDYTAGIAALSERPAEEVSDDLTRLYRRRGTAHSGLTQWQQALDDYARGINAENSDEKILTSQAHAQAQMMLAGLRDWTVLEPLTLESAGGATLTVQDDKSVLASGKNPARDVYTFIARPELTRITGIRLEALADPSLPKNGPGRRNTNGVGNFHLNELSVFSAGTPITLTDAIATFQERNPQGDEPGHAIDGKVDDRRGWSVNPQVGRDHSLTASLNLERAVDDDLKFEFHFSTSRWPEHNLGKFRLSVTDVADPKLLSDELLAAAKLTDPWQQMAAVHRIEGDQQAIDQLVADHPVSAGAVGDMFIQNSQEQNRDWSRAIEIYSLGITPQTTDSELLAKRAAAHEQLQNWDAAAADWARAASEDSEGAQLLADFASRLVDAQQYDLALAQRQRAQKLLEDILQVDPGDAPAVDSLASLLVDISRPLQQWNVFKPAELKTSGGSEVELTEDDALTVSHLRDTVVLSANGKTVNAIRVEISADASSPDDDTAAFTEYQILSTALPADGFRGRYVRLDLPGDSSQFPRYSGDDHKKFINLSELQVFQGNQNIALKKKASASSGGNQARLAAGNAVDGNTVGNDGGNPYVHTWDPENPWWEVDLGSEQDFDRLVVWNRSDSDLYDRMNHFRVRVLDADRRVMFEQVIDKAPAPSRQITRRVKSAQVEPSAAGEDSPWQLSLDTRHGIAPWKAFRVFATEDVPIVAASGVDTQNFQWTVPDNTRMISASGETRAARPDGSFPVDAVVAGSTLSLAALPAETKAIRVETTSAADSSGSSDVSEYRIQAIATSATESESLQGRYVRIDLPGDKEQVPHRELETNGVKILSLAEVQVFQGDENVALRKTARQSSDYGSGEAGKASADRAVDGNTDGSYTNKSVTHTQNQKQDSEPWWEVDLGGEQVIDRLVVWNRSSWEQRLAHFRVRILNRDRQVVFEQVIDEAPNPSTEISFRNLLVADTEQADANQPQWSLRLGSESGLKLGTPFRISSAQQLTSLTEGDLDSADYLSLPFARLAGAYDLNRVSSTAAEWFGRSLDNANNDAGRRKVIGLLQNHAEPLADLLQQRPDSIDLQLAMARSHVRQGNEKRSRQQPEQALVELNRASEIFTGLLDQKSALEWAVLEPMEMKSSGEAMLTLQEDGSILASGKNPEYDTYSLTVDAAPGTITALRLEGIPAPTAPGGGVGRGPGGSVAITNISMELLTDSDSSNVDIPFAAAGSDIGDPAHVLDGLNANFWGVYPDYAKPHQLVLKLKEPLVLTEKTRVGIQLEFLSPTYRTHGLSQFRLSATDAPVTDLHLQLLALNSDELASLDVAIGKVLVQQQKHAEAAAAYTRALERVSDDDDRIKLIDQFKEHLRALSIVAEQRPDDLQVQLAVARKRASNGKKALENENLQNALTQLKTARDIFAKLQAEHRPVQWAVVQPANMVSQSGAELTLRADGAVLVNAENTDTDTYTLTLDSLPETITAVRLEALTDPTLPGEGPGLNSNGNFVLSRINALERDNDVPLQWAGTFADHSQPSWDVAGAIDNSEQSGWAILDADNRNPGMDRFAVFALQHPWKPDGQSDARIQLEFQSRIQHHSLGHFRLSVTSDPNAIEATRFQQELKSSGLADLESSLGKVHGQQGRIDEAAVAFSQALDLTTEVEARANILQDGSAYEGVLDKLTELRPEDSSFHDTLARHFQQAGEIAATRAAAATARTLYEQQLAAKPADTKLTKDLADLLLEVRTPLAFIQLGSQNQPHGVTLLTEPDDGVTKPVMLEGVDCRFIEIQDNDVGHAYLKFDEDIEWMSSTDAEVTVEYWDEGTGSFGIQFESVDNPYQNADHRIELADSRQWKTARFVLEKVRFAAGQNSGADFRLQVNTATLHFKLVTISRRHPAETSSNSMVRLGGAYHTLGDIDKTLELFTRSIERASTDQARAALAQQAAAYPDVFARILEQFPEDKQLRLGQAKYLATKHIADTEFQSAVDVLSAIIETFPDDIELLKQRARAYMKLADWQSADADYAQVIALETDDGRRRTAERTRAEVQLRLGQFQPAAELLLQETMLSPGNIYYLRDACSAQMSAGDLRIAKTIAARFYDKFKGTKDAGHAFRLLRTQIAQPGLVNTQIRGELLGLASTAGDDRKERLTAAIHYRLGDLKKAEPLLNSGGLEFQALAAMLLYDQGNVEQARTRLKSKVTDWFERERQKDPDSAIPAQQRWQEWGAKIAIWREASRKLIGPRIVELDAAVYGGLTLKIMSASYGVNNQQKDVTETLRKHFAESGRLSWHPDYRGVFGDPAPGKYKNITIRYRLNDIEADLFLSQDKPIDFLELAEGLLTQGPTNSAALLERASLLADAGLHEEARDDLERLAALNFDAPEVHALHGRVLAGLNRNEEALTYLNQAIKAGTSDGDIFAVRGKILLQQEQTDAARADLEKSLSLELNESAADALADLLLAEAETNITWTPLTPVKISSTGGATLTLQDDNSILASGTNSLGDTYEITATVPGSGGLAAIRLEALTHESLPNNGPGRDEEKDRGVFAMTGFEIEAHSEDAASETVALSEITADYFTHDLKVDHWNIGGGSSQPHSAVFRVQNPVALKENSQLKFTMRFSANEEWPLQNLGCFRLSFSADPQSMAHEQNRFAAVKMQQPLLKLAAAYALTGTELDLTRLTAGQPALASRTARALMRQQKWKQAIRLIGQALADERPQAGRLALRAEAFGKLQQWETADADWEHALTLQPENETLRQRWLDSLSDGDRWPQIASYYSVLLDDMEENTASYAPRYKLVEEIIRRGDGAFAALQTVRPEDGLLQLSLARDAVLRDDWGTAVEIYPKQFQPVAAPEDGFELAAALLLAGRTAEFQIYLKQVAGEVSDSISDDDTLGFVMGRMAALSTAQAVPWTDVVAWAEPAALDGGAGWHVHAAFMANLRAGNLDRAQEWLAKPNATRWHGGISRLDSCLLSIAKADIDAARRHLQRAHEWLANQEAAKQDGYWSQQAIDWLEFSVLLKECEALLKVDENQKVDESQTADEN